MSDCVAGASSIKTNRAEISYAFDYIRNVHHKCLLVVLKVPPKKFIGQSVCVADKIVIEFI